MANLKLKEKSEAVPEAAAILGQIENKFGFIPNLMKVLANSPAALQGYVVLSELVGKTTFKPEEQQAILLTVSVENGCGYCVAAHSMMAEKMANMASDKLRAIREGREVSDPKLNELIRFTKEVVAERGYVSKETLNHFFAAGYTQQNVLEILTCVAMKTLSNYVNHIADTPVDSQFSSYAWTRK